MNYYNPYLYNIPNYGMTTIPKAGIFTKLLGGINFSSILNGTQRTLNIVNQTIPLVKQAQPIFKNAKTMFKVMNEFKKADTSNNIPVNQNFKENYTNIENNNYNNSNIGPTFFM